VAHTGLKGKNSPELKVLKQYLPHTYYIQGEAF